jgi:hypothetical protein
MLAGAAALAIVAGLVGAARADDEPELVGFRRWTFGIDIFGHATYIDGKSAGGGGLGVEVARGSGRWQYFAECAAVLASLGTHDMLTSTSSSLDGYELRGGVGVRWLARQFALDHGGALEMHLEAVTGVEHFRWIRGGEVTRPDVGLGWAWQARWFTRRLAFHETVRVVFSPSDRVDATAPVSCRGCATTGTVPNAALMALFGVSL